MSTRILILICLYTLALCSDLSFGTGAVLTRVERQRRASDDCLPQLHMCQRDLDAMLYSYSIPGRQDAIRRLGAREFCAVALPASTCTFVVTPNCPPSKSAFVAPYLRDAKKYKYLCQEKYEEVSQHWDCITSPEILNGYFSCKYKFQPVATNSGTCENSERIAQCVMDIASKTETCGPAAYKSTHNFMLKMASFDGIC